MNERGQPASSAAYYNRIAWELIGSAVTMFDLPDESVTGDVIALLAVSMLLRDVRDADRSAEMDGGGGEA